jgi:hypothetical protein
LNQNIEYHFSESMKKISIVFVLVTLFYNVSAQVVTLKQLSTNPDKYLEQTFSFKNIWWYPNLTELENKLDGQTYYNIKLDISENGNKKFEMGRLSPIVGVTTKSIAMQLIMDNKSGYAYNYLGDITGKVIKINNNVNKYLFVITEIIHHGIDSTSFYVKRYS